VIVDIVFDNYKVFNIAASVFGVVIVMTDIFVNDVIMAEYLMVDYYFLSY